MVDDTVLNWVKSKSEEIERRQNLQFETINFTVWGNDKKHIDTIEFAMDQKLSDDLINALMGICWANNSSNKAYKINYLEFASYAISKAIKYGNTATEVKSNDPTNPAHYTTGKWEVIDFIEDKQLGFHLGNAVKYIARAGKKDASKYVEDLQKAKWYIEREIKKQKGDM